MLLFHIWANIQLFLTSTNHFLAHSCAFSHLAFLTIFTLHIFPLNFQLFFRRQFKLFAWFSQRVFLHNVWVRLQSLFLFQFFKYFSYVTMLPLLLIYFLFYLYLIMCLSLNIFKTVAIWLHRVFVNTTVHFSSKSK